MYSFLKKALHDFKKTGAKLVLIYRYTYELNSCADIFKDVLKLYPEYGETMQGASHAKGLFYELFLDKESIYKKATFATSKTK